MSMTVSVLVRNLAIVSGIFLLAACNRYHQPAYFEKGILDSTRNSRYTVPEAVIQRGDLLGITIYSDNPTATAIFNQAGQGSAASIPADGVTGGVSTGSSAAISGSPTYLVDQQGQIRLHAIGKLTVEGMRKDELAEAITARLTQLGVLTNPYCIVRFNNFKVTVIGEVKNPGVFTLPAEKASVLEVMGLAGDFTPFSLRDKVLLVREFNGERTYHTLDLTDPQVFNSPNFYLRQNDVLVVNADPKKPNEVDQNRMRNISLGLAVVSTLLVIVTLFR
jgi:polysaccharide export outer membrane protein